MNVTPRVDPEGSITTPTARIAFVVGLATLACGLPYWSIPYRELSLPGHPSSALWLALGGGVGLVAGYLLPGFRVPWLSVAGGFVLAVILRVSVETHRDPTSHNLWPLEVVIVGLVGLAAGLIGVAVARLVQRIVPR